MHIYSKISFERVNVVTFMVLWTVAANIYPEREREGERDPDT